MSTPSKEKAIELVTKCIAEGDKVLESSGGDWPLEYGTWIRNTRKRIEAVFGSASTHIGELSPILDELSRLSNFKDIADRTYVRARATIKSFITEIEDIWSDFPLSPLKTSADVTPEIANNAEMPPSTPSREVFVVHGHDHEKMQTLARFLERIGLQAVILHEQASIGATIVEKLEAYANVAFAVVLLTPDDIGGIAGGSQNSRARQNVVLELGYFLGKLGRKRTCALVVEGVEIPSDFSGVIYILMDTNGAWKLHLARELRAAGLKINLQRIL